MDAAIAAAILWAATGVRIYSTIRRPDTGRILMTAAAVCVACAFTLAPLRVTFDEMLGWPNGAELVQHLLFATAGLLTLLFLQVIRTGRLSLAALAGHVAAFTAAATTMVVAFSAADIHGATAAHFATEYAHDGFAVAYRLVFYAYLGRKPHRHLRDLPAQRRPRRRPRRSAQPVRHRRRSCRSSRGRRSPARVR